MDSHICIYYLVKNRLRTTACLASINASERVHFIDIDTFGIVAGRYYNKHCFSTFEF